MPWTCTEGDVYARHTDGRIVELVGPWDPAGDEYSMTNAILVDESGQPVGGRGPDLIVSSGGVRDAGTPEAPSVDQMIATVDAEVRRRILDGVDFAGLRFRASDTDQSRISDLALNAVLAQMGAGVLSYPIDVPSDTIVDGVQQLLTLADPAETLQFCGAIKLHVLGSVAAGRAAKDAIRQAADDTSAAAALAAYLGGA